MKKIFLLILIIISVAAIHSCKKPILEGPGVLAGPELDVYGAGCEYNSNTSSGMAGDTDNCPNSGGSGCQYYSQVWKLVF